MIPTKEDSSIPYRPRSNELRARVVERDLHLGLVMQRSRDLARLNSPTKSGSVPIEVAFDSAFIKELKTMTEVARSWGYPFRHSDPLAGAVTSIRRRRALMREALRRRPG